ncbi:MAG: Peptidyl-tRNA hydrolase, archaeal type [Myxococcaceae bacterium]|jgi:hypothetical protein|nr:Peptidyl-tRNA hydrolase, archaeal type [Myxococcaceae bacterium]
MDDQELWQAFGSASLPEKDWTHRGHLRVAWLYSQRHPLDEAHVLMRVGIIRLNAFHGLVETPARGYHETITRVWLAIVRALMKEVPAASSLAFVEACGDRLGRDALLRHYSRERLTSVEARARFVEPDLARLP